MNKLKELRVKKGFSGKQFAEIIGVQQGQISNIENGKTMPRIERMKKIAEALGVGVEEVFPNVYNDDDKNTVNINIRISSTLKKEIDKKTDFLNVSIAEYLKYLICKDIYNKESEDNNMEQTIFTGDMLKLMGECYQGLLYVLNERGNDFNGNPTVTMLKSFMILHAKASHFKIPKKLDKKIEELMNMLDPKDLEEHFLDPVPNELYECFDIGVHKAIREHMGIH